MYEWATNDLACWFIYLFLASQSLVTIHGHMMKQHKASLWNDLTTSGLKYNIQTKFHGDLLFWNYAVASTWWL